MADIERWITVNGAHIPIMKGESKATAVGKFIRSKQKYKKDRYHQIYDDMKEKGLSAQDAEIEAELSSGYKGKRKIKGRAETKSEKLDKLFDKAADAEIEKDYLFDKGSLREYQNAKVRYEMANKRYEKEKNKPTSRYKLKSSNSEIGNTYKENRGNELKIKSISDKGMVTATYIPNSGKSYQMTFKNIETLKEQLKKSGFKKK